MIPLFDDIPRTDQTLKRHAESDFDFMNRIAGEPYDIVRTTLESWFRLFPSHGPWKRLRGRIRSGDDRQYRSAVWELFIHRLLRATWEHVEYEPVDGSADFIVTLDADRKFVVEATAIHPSDDEVTELATEAQILDLIDTYRVRWFWGDLDLQRRHDTAPDLDQLRLQLDRWIPDADRVASLGQTPTPFRFADADWVVTIDAHPADMRSSSPVVGMGPGRSGWGDTAKLRKVMYRKRPQTLGDGLPNILALISTRSLSHESHIEDALFGNMGVVLDGSDAEPRVTRIPDGEWLRHQWENIADSAVLYAEWATELFLHNRPLSLWLHPRSDRPLPCTPLWSTTVWVDDAGQLQRREPAIPVGTLLEPEYAENRKRLESWQRQARDARRFTS